MCSTYLYLCYTVRKHGIELSLRYSAPPKLWIYLTLIMTRINLNMTPCLSCKKDLEVSMYKTNDAVCHSFILRSIHSHSGCIWIYHTQPDVSVWQMHTTSTWVRIDRIVNSCACIVRILLGQCSYCPTFKSEIIISAIKIKSLESRLQIKFKPFCPWSNELSSSFLVQGFVNHSLLLYSSFVLQGFLNYYDACSEGLKAAHLRLKLGVPADSCREPSKEQPVKKSWALMDLYYIPPLCPTRISELLRRMFRGPQGGPSESEDRWPCRQL